MSIILFSGPVHSGKTSELLHWCNKQKNVHGILMPDINGSRKILDIKTRGIFDIECTDTENTKEPLTTVGKYNFYTSTFEKANSILISALTHEPDWLIIDEAGKLELDGKGFYTAIIKAADRYNHNKSNGNLLMTIRDGLCGEVIDFFKLNEYRIIHRLEGLG